MGDVASTHQQMWAAYSSLLRRFADEGYYTMVPSAAAPYSFGVPSGGTSMVSACSSYGHTTGQSSLGHTLIGVGSGAGAVLSWLLTWPQLVDKIILVNPIVDVTATRLADVGGVRALIDTYYPHALYPAAIPEGQEPIDASVIAAFVAAKIPTLYYYSSGDQWTSEAAHLAFAEQLGVTPKLISASNHTTATIELCVSRTFQDEILTFNRGKTNGNPMVLIDGQSNSVSPSIYESFGCHLMTKPGRIGCPYRVVGVAGTSYPTRWATLGTRVEPHINMKRNAQGFYEPRFAGAPFHTIGFFEGGHSDLTEWPTAVEAFTGTHGIKDYIERLKTYGLEWAAFATIPPNGYGAPFDAAWNARRLAFNDLLRANYRSYNIDFVVDVAEDPTLNDVTNVAVYYDLLHYTLATSKHVAGLWDAALPSMTKIEEGLPPIV